MNCSRIDLKKIAFFDRDSVKSVADLPVNTLNELYVCKYFHIYKIEVSGKMTFEQNAPFMFQNECSAFDRMNCSRIDLKKIAFFDRDLTDKFTPLSLMDHPA